MKDFQKKWADEQIGQPRFNRTTGSDQVVTGYTEGTKGNGVWFHFDGLPSTYRKYPLGLGPSMSPHEQTQYLKQVVNQIGPYAVVSTIIRNCRLWGYGDFDFGSLGTEAGSELLKSISTQMEQFGHICGWTFKTITRHGLPLIVLRKQ